MKAAQILLCIWLSSCATQLAGNADLPGWLSLSGPPSFAERQCAALLHTAVKRRGNKWGQTQASPEIRAKLFPVAKFGDFRETALQLEDGWLVGIDGGEWGGALHWVTATKDKSTVVFEEPTRALRRVGDKVFAFTSLCHGATSEAAIYALSFSHGQIV